MPGNRKPSKFRKNDLVRAMRAAFAAGATLQRVEIDPDGRIVMIVSGEHATKQPAKASGVSAVPIPANQ